MVYLKVTPYWFTPYGYAKKKKRKKVEVKSCVSGVNLFNLKNITNLGIGDLCQPTRDCANSIKSHRFQKIGVVEKVVEDSLCAKGPRAIVLFRLSQY
jgi:hypothetical protein